MTSKLDELFSPDRLRQNWQNSLVPVVAPLENIANSNIHNQYLKLHNLITDKFPDIPLLLSEKLEDLNKNIESIFDVNTTAPADVGQKDIIMTLLEELEETLWAMELLQKDKQ
ncbi:MAG: hypothetical protein GQ569_04315 [Methylococcaceae bacterium]|nr:hypothetical protein [Methylococcaceae bacterium]